MPKIYECQKVRSEVTSLQSLNNDTIALSTKIHGIRIFNTDDCKNRQILSVSQLNHKTTAVAFHPSKNICAIANDKVIYIVSLTNKSILQTIYTHNGKINILCFMPNRPYLVSGTDEARVMLYRYYGQSEISRLASFRNTKSNKQTTNKYISAFAFSQNYMACSGYGGCVILINLHSHKQINKFCNSKVRVDALCFINEETLLFANTDGTLYVQSLKNRENFFSINMPFPNIKNILYFPASDFALVSGKSHSIALVNVTTKKLITPQYILFEDEVHTMSFTNDLNLIVALKNRQIYHVKFANVQDLKMCILKKDLPEAFKIIDSDPRLQGTKEHKRVEALYDKLYAKAFAQLIDSNKKELRKSIDILQKLNSKTEAISLLFKAYDNYPKFQLFYLEKKYALAYKLSEKYPPLQQTPQYKKMEKHFKEVYTFAQKQIFTGRLDIAKDLLSPYITILSKRPLIHLLLRQNKEFLIFLKALQNKEYKTIHKLAQKHEIFKDIPGYAALQRSQEILLKNISNTISSAKVDEAIEQIKSLQSVTCNEDILKELYDNAMAVKKLLSSYEKNDFKKCYELIDSDERLQKLEITKLLEKHWQKLMNKCEEYALDGNIQSIKETLRELIGIPSRAQRTGDLLRLSFYTQIKHLIKKNKFTSAENIIYSYIDIFGLDKEIKVIMKNYELYTAKKLAITHEQEKKRSRDSWLQLPIFICS